MIQDLGRSLAVQETLVQFFGFLQSSCIRSSHLGSDQTTGSQLPKIFVGLNLIPTPEIHLCIYCICVCKERLINVDWLISLLLRASPLWSNVAMSTLHSKTLNCPASPVALLWHSNIIIIFCDFFQFKELEIII